MKQIGSIFTLLILSFAIACDRPAPYTDALFVWHDSTGLERNDYALFRYDFQLQDSLIKNAEIHLFADSRYHLIVNGHFINFGPSRGYPEHPEYDSYNIAPYLQRGKNCITVKALSNGMNTFQLPLSRGGFIAWGEVSTPTGRSFDLSTPGNWKCVELNAYDRQAPKMSFATGAVEIHDARKDPASLYDPRSDLDLWKKVIPVPGQDHWGSLLPRQIPHLTQNERLPLYLTGKYKLSTDEELYSFRVKTKDRTRQEFTANKRVFAYTYIYSPKRQNVKAGMWWGEFWLNGKGPIQGVGIEPGKPNRNDIMLELKRGWNFFFIKYDVVWASWEFYVALPRDKGLIVSAGKEESSPYIFKTAGPFLAAEEDSVRQLPLPFEDPGDLPDLSARWTGKERGKTAGNPAWEIAWSCFEEELPSQTHRVTGLQVEDTFPAAFVFDMGQKTLGRLFIDYEAPRGTVFDLGFAEDTLGNRPYILKRAGLYTGVRHIARGGKNRFESFKPYGARFIQLNISRHSGPVTIMRTGMVSQIYPFDKKGTFRCSDPMFKEIWELGWRTLRVCAEDSYTDTPFRERGLYAGDALPEYAITLAGSGDSRLMKKSITILADMYRDLMIPETEQVYASVNHMSDYPLLTLEAYAWVINRTGDLKFAREYYPGYKIMLDRLEDSKQENGLYGHGRAFIEWTGIDKNALLTSMQALIARSFRSLAYVADRLGKHGDRDELREKATELEERIQVLCWDEKAGAFHDGFKDGKQIDHHYPISSAWPVLWGISTPEQDKRLRVYFERTLVDIGDRDRQRRATPYGGFYILSALCKLGYTGIAEDFIRKYWSPMILKYNDTAWENFGDGRDGGQGTLSHAWSGGPTFVMSSYILGVDLGYPDFTEPERVRIAPRAEGISWASGTVPHPKGEIRVSWHRDKDKLVVQCEIPPGVEYIVEPKGALAGKELWVNGRKAR